MGIIKVNTSRIIEDFIFEHPEYKHSNPKVVLSPFQYFISDENEKQISDLYYPGKGNEFSDTPVVYGYARVSTKIQASEGNSLESQKRQLREAGATIIYEDAFTDTKSARPELDRLKSALVPGDKVIVTKLDRLARSTEDGLQLIKVWLDNGISIHVLNMGLIDNTPTGRLILTVFLAFAEFERDMILERTQEGRAIARQKPDYQEGRKKKFTKDQIEHALDLLDSHSFKQVVDMTGISKSSLIRAKKARDNSNAQI